MSIASELLMIKGDKSFFIPADIWKWANKHRQSDIGKEIDWDKDEASYNWQIHQIRRLIQVHIVYEEGDRKSISLSIDRSAGGGYRNIEDVVKDHSLYDIMLSDAIAEFERLQRKYERHLKELKPIWVIIAKIKRGRGGGSAGMAAE